MQTPDCEQIRQFAWLAQPVNAWSSLVFAFAGAVIFVRAVRGDHGRTPELAVFAVAVGANAIGSFLYHGFRGDPQHWAHDVCIYAVLAFVAIHAFGTVQAWPRRKTFAVFGTSVALLGLLRWATGVGGLRVRRRRAVVAGRDERHVVVVAAPSWTRAASARSTTLPCGTVRLGGRRVPAPSGDP